MKKRFFLYYLPAILYAGVIFALSSMKNLHIPDIGISWSDKIAHFMEYSIFSFFMVRAFYYGSSPENRKRNLWIAILLSLLYAASDEFHQIYVPGRTASVSDWMADSVGITLGYFLFFYWKKIEDRFRHFLA
ncbi:vanZ like family protein [bacterium BMS3Bbin03]|nr:vanZ like family protein [bacterium BMS3Bbin03]HDZ12324.1 VanZ family protein [Bacteroidota bacterium]